MKSFSQESPDILEEKPRLQIAYQIKNVLSKHLREKQMSDLKLLDIGCSSGVITHYLAGFFKNTVGIDIDTDAIQIAKQKYTRKNLAYFYMNSVHTSFKSGEFDVVLCHQVYQYIKDHRQLVDEIKRVLKPAGICYFAGINKLIYPGKKFPYPLTYWQLKELSKDFKIHRYTPIVLKNSSEFGFVKIEKLQKIFRNVPLRIWQSFEFLSPNFIWILEKRK
jgi:2-polyprenyl-3-methyl-5-hydroxy-6-metoxy-1,4-benzoquinol methylase